jgi:hypothetical protein
MLLDGTPPPGTYNPTFLTDVACCKRAPNFDSISSNQERSSKSTNVSRTGSRYRFTSPPHSGARARSSSGVTCRKAFDDCFTITGERNITSAKRAGSLKSDPRHRIKLNIHKSTWTIPLIQEHKYCEANEQPETNVVQQEEYLVLESQMHTIQQEKEMYKQMFEKLLAETETAQEEWSCVQNDYYKTIKESANLNGQLNSTVEQFKPRFEAMNALRQSMHQKLDSAKQRIESLTKELIEATRVQRKVQDIQGELEKKQQELQNSEDKCHLLIEQLESYRLASLDKQSDNIEFLQDEISKLRQNNKEQKLKLRLSQEEEIKLRQIIREEKLLSELKDKDIKIIKDFNESLRKSYEILQQEMSDKEEELMRKNLEISGLRNSQLEFTDNVRGVVSKSLDRKCSLNKVMDGIILMKVVRIKNMKFKENMFLKLLTYP